MSAKGSDGCILDIRGTLGVTICGGEIVDSVPLPRVTVTENVVRRITDTVTETIRVRVPGPTVRVTVPGPTSTVKIPQDVETVFRPGETVTVFVSRGPQGVTTETATSAPRRGPVETVTETVTPSPPRQDPTDDATIDSPGEFFTPDINFGDNRPTVAEVGIGLLTALLILAITMLGMFYGYRIGRKRQENDETNFIRALLDEAKIRRGKHS